jgi:hypothetical protein
MVSEFIVAYAALPLARAAHNGESASPWVSRPNGLEPAQRATECSPGRVREPCVSIRNGLEPAQRATECSPGRVREPWVSRRTGLEPAQRATECSPGRVREPWVSIRNGLEPAQRATECSPGRVREPWVSRRTGLEPAQRATECSPGRVREPWVSRPNGLEPAQRATETGIERNTNCNKSHMSASFNMLGLTIFSLLVSQRPSYVRLLSSPAYLLARLHFIARGAGSCHQLFRYPGLADSPWATLFRPRRGLVPSVVPLPRARRLSLGYTLSPAARACAIGGLVPSVIPLLRIPSWKGQLPHYLTKSGIYAEPVILRPTPRHHDKQRISVIDRLLR